MIDIDAILETIYHRINELKSQTRDEQDQTTIEMIYNRIEELRFVIRLLVKG